MAEAKIDVSEIERLQQKLEQYGSKSGQIVQDYLKDKGFERLSLSAQSLIHPSYRTPWRRKSASATMAVYTYVFSRVVVGMTLDVYTTSRYSYLYFPDDGSNTIRHAGMQEFMWRGADKASDQMVDEIIERLVAAFEEA